MAAVASACSFRVVFQALCGVFTNPTLVEQGFVVSIWNSFLLLVLRLMDSDGYKLVEFIGS